MKQKHEWILMVKRKYTKKKALLFLNPFSFSEVKTGVNLSKFFIMHLNV